MTMQIGRPVEFNEAKREKFCALVGVGVSRRHAATSVGVSPSTVSRHMAADLAFAEQVREAEADCELDLMRRVRLQSERSWRAAVWLLERMRPERYARGKAAPQAASWDDMFDKFVNLIDEEIGDEALRERLACRLDEMALEELAAQDLDNAALPAHDALPSRPTQAEKPQASHPPRADKHSQAGVAHSAPLPADRVEGKLGHGKPLNRQGGRAADFCNTSPDVHERRALATVCT